MRLWGVLWRSVNRLDGVTEHLIYQAGVPYLFPSRAKAVEWIKRTHGYVATRRDLRGEPHGWRVPRPVRVSLEREGQP